MDESMYDAIYALRETYARNMEESESDEEYAQYHAAWVAVCQVIDIID